MITDQYTLNDVVKDLNEVAPYDWKTFFQKRVYDLHPQVPMNGFTQGGYKLVYTDKPTEWMAKELGQLGYADFSTSLGISVGSRRDMGRPALYPMCGGIVRRSRPASLRIWKSFR